MAMVHISLILKQDIKNNPLTRQNAGNSFGCVSHLRATAFLIGLICLT